MDPKATEPADIQLDGPEEPLTITWADGHVSALSPAHLRLWCPCAQCTDHGALDLSARLARRPSGRQIQIREVSEVGSYALAITFADGHAYGLYSWHHLRDICPCEVCQVPALRDL